MELEEDPRRRKKSPSPSTRPRRGDQTQAQSQSRHRSTSGTRTTFNPDDVHTVTSTSSSSTDASDKYNELEQGDSDGRTGAGHVTRVTRFTESLSALNGTKEPWVPAPGRTTRPKSAITSSEVSSALPDHDHGHVSGISGIGDGVPVTVLHQRQRKDKNTGAFPHRRHRKDRHKRQSQEDGIRSRSVSAPRSRSLSKDDTPAKSKAEEEQNSADGGGVGGGRLISNPESPSPSLTGYTLQSKDSLVDVAACLNSRREEVLRLWQQNISNVALAEEVEKANQLAIEAGHDVVELRQSIHAFQQKKTLTDEDSASLNRLRNRIISKLELFEETHAQIQLNLHRLRKSAAVVAVGSKNTLAPVSETSSANFAKLNQSSQTQFTSAAATPTPHVKAKASPSNTSLIYIKKKNTEFQDLESASSENEAQQEMLNNMKVTSQAPPPAETHLHTHLPKFLKPKSSQSLDRISEEQSRSLSSPKSPLPARPAPKSQLSKSKARSKEKQKQVPLNNSKQRYKDQNLEELEGASTSSMSSEEIVELKKPYQIYAESDYADDEELPLRGTGAPGVNANADLTYYRNKLQKLHRQLLEQDTKYELLSRDVQKYESQSGFDLMLFKSTVASRLEELEPYPELLAITEKRLAETLQSKLVLEADLKVKVQELGSAKKEIEKLTKEVIETKLHSSTIQEKSDRLSRKAAKYKASNEAYSGKIVELQKKLESARQTLAVSARQRADGRIIYWNPTKVAILEDRLAELKRELKNERKNVAVLKEEKNSISARMAQRLQQLMAALEQSRARNGDLVKQLRFVRSSYYELFPNVQIPSSAFTGTGTETTATSHKLSGHAKFVMQNFF